MTYLDEIVPPQELARSIADGFVCARRVTPDDGVERDMTLFTLTPQAAFQKTWQPATMVVRGMVVDSETGLVLARSFPKFFNYGQDGAPELTPDTRVFASDKLDGSLGILLPESGRIVTRGSFSSEQAVHATELYRSRYQGRWQPPAGITPLFEVIYPENRIVVSYTDDDLFLLGGVEIKTGRVLGVNDPEFASWPGPRTTVLAGIETLADALSAPDRVNAEGMVLRVLDGPDAGTLVKVKQQDYLQLHRIMTNTTPERLWQVLAVHDLKQSITAANQWASRLRLDPADAEAALALGDDWRTTMFATVPDEWHEWATGVISAIQHEVDTFVSRITTAVEDLAERTFQSPRHRFEYASQVYGTDAGLVVSLSKMPADAAYQRLWTAAWRAARPTS